MTTISRRRSPRRHVLSLFHRRRKTPVFSTSSASRTTHYSQVSSVSKCPSRGFQFPCPAPSQSKSGSDSDSENPMNGPVVVRRSYALRSTLTSSFNPSNPSAPNALARPTSRTSALAHPKPSGNAIDTHPIAHHVLGTPTRPGTKELCAWPRGGRGGGR